MNRRQKLSSRKLPSNAPRNPKQGNRKKTFSGSLRRMASRFWKEHPKEFALFRTSQKNSTQSFKHIVNDVNGFPPYDAVWEKAFAVYKTHSEHFHFKEWEDIYGDLTKKNQHGLSVPTNTRTSRGTDKYTRNAGNLTAMELENLAADICTIFLKEGLYIDEAEVVSCLTLSLNRAPTSSNECLSPAKPMDFPFPGRRISTSIHRDEHVLETRLRTIGDISSVLNEVTLTLEGILDDDAVVALLSDLVVLSSSASGVLFLGGKEAKQFTKAAVASMDRLLISTLENLHNMQKQVGSEEDALLNLVEKVVYLCIRTGYHPRLETRTLVYSFATKVWSKLRMHQYQELFTIQFPFLMHKLILWDNLDNHTHHFSRKQLSTLLKQFKRSFEDIIRLSRTPLFDCLEVVAVTLHRNKIKLSKRDEFVQMQKTCLEMLLDGLHSEPMDDPSFAPVALEYYYRGDISTPDDNPFFTGPIGLAVRHGIAEFLCLQKVQDILIQRWYGTLQHCFCSHDTPNQLETFAELLGCECLFVNSLALGSYKSCPLLVAYADFCVWLTCLGCTYTTILTETQINRIGFTNTFTVYHYILCVITGGMFVKEIRQIMTFGLTYYLSHARNYLDILIIFTVAAFSVCRGSPHISNMYAFHLLSVVSLFVLFRALQFAIVFKSYGMFVNALFLMVGNATKFLVFFFIILAGFAVVMVSLFPELSAFSNFGYSSVSLFSAAMANFDYGWFHGTENYWEGVTLLTIYIVISCIILLNMLIALLAETYSKMSDVSHQYSAVNIANFIEEYHEQNMLPVPFNCVELLFNGLLGVLQGTLKECLQRALRYLHFLIDFSVTTVFFSPLGCFFDAWFIAKTICSWAKKDHKRFMRKIISEVDPLSTFRPDTVLTKCYRALTLIINFSCYAVFLITVLSVFVALYPIYMSFNIIFAQCLGKKNNNNPLLEKDDMWNQNHVMQISQLSNLCDLKRAMLKNWKNETGEGTEENQQGMDRITALEQTLLEKFKDQEAQQQRLLEKLKNQEVQHQQLLKNMQATEDQLLKKLQATEEANIKMLTLLEEHVRSNKQDK